MSPFKRNASARAARQAGEHVESAPRMSPGSLRPADMRPGRAYEARHLHDPRCRRPKGGLCTCRKGPDLEIRPLVDPRSN
jgi:hypothetical protein